MFQSNHLRDYILFPRYKNCRIILWELYLESNHMLPIKHHHLHFNSTNFDHNLYSFIFASKDILGISNQIHVRRMKNSFLLFFFFINPLFTDCLLGTGWYIMWGPNLLDLFISFSSGSMEMRGGGYPTGRLDTH